MKNFFGMTNQQIARYWMRKAFIDYELSEKMLIERDKSRSFLDRSCLLRNANTIYLLADAASHEAERFFNRS